MECPKCKGLMMLERFSDFFLIFYAWKCINCGAIIDRTISNNRRKSLAARDAQTVATHGKLAIRAIPARLVSTRGCVDTYTPRCSPDASRSSDSQDGIIAIASKVVKTLPFLTLPRSFFPHASISQPTPRFNSTHLDPFKNAMLESVASDNDLSP